MSNSLEKNLGPFHLLSSLFLSSLFLALICAHTATHTRTLTHTHTHTQTPSDILRRASWRTTFENAMMKSQITISQISTPKIFRLNKIPKSKNPKRCFIQTSPNSYLFPERVESSLLVCLFKVKHCSDDDWLQENPFSRKLFI